MPELAEEAFVAAPLGVVQWCARCSLEPEDASPEAGGVGRPALLRAHGREPGEAVGDLQVVLQLEADLEALQVGPRRLPRGASVERLGAEAAEPCGGPPGPQPERLGRRGR